MLFVSKITEKGETRRMAKYIMAFMPESWLNMATANASAMTSFGILPLRRDILRNSEQHRN